MIKGDVMKLRIIRIMTSLICIICLFSFFSKLIYALDIAQTPLVIKQAVKPNVIIALDDSGSMDSEVLMPTNDGALWWNTDHDSFYGLDSQDILTNLNLNFNKTGDANSTWKKYVYLFPNGVGASNGLRLYSDGSNPHYAIPPIPEYAYTRSPEYNKSYFDPSVTYSPWSAYGSTTFSDSDPESAKSDPVRGTTTLNLKEDIWSDAENHTFKMFDGMVIPAGIYRKIGSGVEGESSTDEIITADENVAIKYYPATFYLLPDTELPEGYGFNHSKIISGFTPDGSLMSGYEIRSENFDNVENFYLAIQNFANWYTYYRKRHAATISGIGSAFKDITNLRVTSFLINSRTNLSMKDLGVESEKISFYQTIYNLSANDKGTPNKEAVDHIGKQFMRVGSSVPITNECQQNFGILFTDGFSNTWWSADVGNADADQGEPFADEVSDTMADIAMHYYKTNLRTDLVPTGKVPVPAQCRRANPSKRLDCNTNLHMVTFAVTLGAQGQIFNVDMHATDDPFSNPPTWPDRTTLDNKRHPSSVDDLWHATINSRGQLLNANTPRDISEGLKAVLADIALRTSSVASITTNTTRLDTQTLIYQARFNSEDWSGQLLAYSLNTDGSVNELVWDAAEKIPEHDTRNIFTFNKTNSTGVVFTEDNWGNLSSEQQGDLATNATLSYIRGDPSNEGTFRNRNSILGDIINSDPLFVKNPNFGYGVLPDTEGSSYLTYRDSEIYLNRPPVIYIGANDGMLHAFEASSDAITGGVELFAFIPHGVFDAKTNRLASLADPGYTHKYFVDGSPRVGDAYIDIGEGDEWRTILVGSTGAGGRSVFALDITDPENFTKDNILWEFSHTELGYTIGQPTIARMATGDWVAVFGNGYGSTSGKAQLFVVDLESGTLLKLIDTGAGSNNGLASPIPVDSDNDRITDFVYAGDLLGNMWSFKFPGENNINGWDVSYKTGSTPTPLITVKDDYNIPQPITSRPAVGGHPDGGVMVYFGTGKFFEEGDNAVDTNGTIESFYGIRDNGSAVAGRSVLQEQEITHEFEAFNRNIRVTSQNATNYTVDEPPDNPIRHGWYIDLVSPEEGYQGERVVSQPLLRHSRIIFTTLIPSANPCDFGGTGWLMELDAVSGSRLDYSAFDFNGDDFFNTDDYVTIKETIINDDNVEVTIEIPVPVSGIQSEVGIIQTPAVVTAGGDDSDLEYKFFSGSTGEIEVLKEKAGDAHGLGRQSWRQLR